jgi:hypothetical protein
MMNKIAYLGLALVVCAGCGGGTSSGSAASTPVTTTSGVSSMSLDGKSYDVTLDVPGEKAEKDTLNFEGGKFESTACTPLGFPKWTAYSARAEGEGTSFHAVTRHPSGTTMDWNGTVKGDAIEGVATRTMDGKSMPGKFKGTIRH